MPWMFKKAGKIRNKMTIIDFSASVGTRQTLFLAPPVWPSVNGFQISLNSPNSNGF